MDKLTDPFITICSFLSLDDIYMMLRVNKRLNSFNHLACYTARSKACRAIDAFMDFIDHRNESEVLDFTISMLDNLRKWKYLIMEILVDRDYRRICSALLYRWGSSASKSTTIEEYKESKERIEKAASMRVGRWPTSLSSIVSKSTISINGHISSVIYPGAIVDVPLPGSTGGTAIGRCTGMVYNNELSFGSFEYPIETRKHNGEDYVVIRLNGRRGMIPIIWLPD
jgi:hypothetical protein